MTSPRSADELIKALGVSRATLARYVTAAGGEVVRVGRTRAVRYLATRAIDGVGREVELFRVAHNGNVQPFGIMHLQYGDGAVVERTSGRVSTHKSIPWFLDDARPQGFLGSIFVRSHPELALPPIDRWRSDDIVRALALRGEDLSGDLMVGAESVARLQALAREPSRFVEESERVERYPQLAAALLAGELPGSSAGGEHPKFVTTVRSAKQARAVIVKFSPRLHEHGGRRWADLLACESLALETLRMGGFATAPTQLVVSGDRVFLESQRFDRVGVSGRAAVVSMGPVDAAFIAGSTQSWSNVAHALARQKQLAPQDAQTVYRIEAFGQMIFNSDRHLGNMSLFWDDDDTFRLAPCYDMLPMLFRPTVHGTPPRIEPPTFDSRTVSVWSEMRSLALAFWHRVQNSEHVSYEFKRDCAVPAVIALG